MEALSATGLRSIRYAKEIPNVDLIIANDLDPDAVELIRKNVEENLGENAKVKPNNADAM
jgi:tRNA (guanine26-N2/guanine27-N2)-dimethyltransferase